MEKDHQNKKLLSAEEILSRHHKWIRKCEFDKLVAEKKRGNNSEQETLSRKNIRTRKS